MAEGSPDNRVGILGKYTVSAHGWVEVRLTADYDDIVQVSVHGNERAWYFHFGDGNGPAELLGAEVMDAKQPRASGAGQ